MLYRTRIVLGLALIWGIDAAATFVLNDKEQIVLNGIVLVSSAALLAHWAHARTRAVVLAANEREAALIETIGRLAGVKRTGPMPTLRDVA